MDFDQAIAFVKGTSMDKLLKSFRPEVALPSFRALRDTIQNKVADITDGPAKKTIGGCGQDLHTDSRGGGM